VLRAGPGNFFQLKRRSSMNTLLAPSGRWRFDEQKEPVMFKLGKVSVETLGTKGAPPEEIVDVPDTQL
jgi:hypothetical protein